VKSLFIILVAAISYYTLAFLASGQLFGTVPGLDWMQSSFGRMAGARIWAHSVHALALLIAGIPSALLLSFTRRDQANLFAAITGVLTAVASLNPNILFYRGHLYPDVQIAHITIDSIKFVLILLLLTWLAGKLPSNYAMQRSSHVGTPLARAASGDSKVRSASGAPTARRR
jgi:hypothetical protein